MIVAFIVGIIGLVCFYAEFFLPGGILVIVGVMLLIASTIAFAMDVHSWAWSFFYVVLLLVLSGVACVIALRQVKRSGRKNSFFLSTDQEGFCSDKIEQELMGAIGVVLTELKPAGHVRIGEKTYQATSIGPFLSKGQKIVVVGVQGSRVLVKNQEDKEI